MKTLIKTIAIVLISINVNAQKIYNLNIKTEDQLIGKAIATKDKAIFKKDTLIVFKNELGRLFVIYTNKKGLYAKKYIN